MGTDFPPRTPTRRAQPPPEVRDFLLALRSFPDTQLLPSRNRGGIRKGRRHTVTPVFLISSALEIFLVLFAGAVFLTMIIAAVAALVWFGAGLFSATRQTPTGTR